MTPTARVNTFKQLKELIDEKLVVDIVTASDTIINIEFKSGATLGCYVENLDRIAILEYFYTTLTMEKFIALSSVKKLELHVKSVVEDRGYVHSNFKSIEAYISGVAIMDSGARVPIAPSSERTGRGDDHISERFLTDTLVPVLKNVINRENSKELSASLKYFASLSRKDTKMKKGKATTVGYKIYIEKEKNNE